MADIRLDLDHAFLGPYKKTQYSMKKFQILDGGRASLKTTRHVTRMIIDMILIPNTISFAMAKEATKLDTGLVSEFEKVIERVSKGKYREYRIHKNPRKIVFNNGSELHFLGSKNWSSLKGRSVPSSNHRFGAILFDEFADYDEKDGLEMVEKLVPTLIRDDYRGPFNHYFWEEKDLDLDYPIYDENGKVVVVENVYGEFTPSMHSGIHTMGCKFFFSSNPPKNKYHWYFEFRNEYAKRPDAMVMKVNYNDLLSELITIGQQSIIAEAERTREINPRRYEHEWLGNATGVDGLFFKSYDVNETRLGSIDGLVFKKFGIGVDFGVSNPTTFVFGGFTDTNDFVTLKLYVHSNRDTNEEKGSSAYAEDLIQFAKECRNMIGIDDVLPVFYDPSAKSFRNDVVAKLKRRKSEKTLIKLYKADNDRFKTLSFVNDLISSKHFKTYVDTKHMTVFENEFLRAEEHPKGDDIIKEDDHFIDAVRYLTWKLKSKLRVTL